MSLFQNARFHITVNHLKDLPDTGAEIAFAGRSNAGKSSALNTMANRTRLAFVSKTPGRTQHINYFDLDQNRFLVDLPGYGYAQVPEAVRTHWVALLGRAETQREDGIARVVFTKGDIYFSRDVATDPTKGFYIDATAKPFLGFGTTGSGLRATLDGRIYHSLGAEGRLVIAARAQAVVRRRRTARRSVAPRRTNPR